MSRPKVRHIGTGRLVHSLRGVGGMKQTREPKGVETGEPSGGTMALLLALAVAAGLLGSVLGPRLRNNVEHRFYQTSSTTAVETWAYRLPLGFRAVWQQSEPGRPDDGFRMLWREDGKK